MVPNNNKLEVKKRIILELVIISKSDLRASKILHGKKLYPQSVFYLEQSVEKLMKAYGLVNDLITPQELIDRKKASHLAVKIFLQEEQKVKNRLTNMSKFMDQHPDETRNFVFNGKNGFEIHKKQLEESLKFYETIKDATKNPYEGFAEKKKEIIKLTSKIYKTESDFNKFNKKFKRIDNSLLREELKKSMKMVSKNLLPIIKVTKPDEYLEAKKAFEEMNIDLLIPYVKRLMLNISEEYYIRLSLACLTLITMSHINITRYPYVNSDLEENYEYTSEIYTKDLGIIKTYAELVDIAGKTIDKFDNLYDITPKSMFRRILLSLR